jgi:LPXTG-motif cell wall-anchored protein
MLSRVIRTAAVSALCLGGSFVVSSAAFAQDATTTTVAAAVATETTVAAAAVTETTVAAAAEPAAVVEATPAVAPAGAVAAGGGFLSTDGNSTLPIVLAGAALVAGAGIVVARRRKA